MSSSEVPLHAMIVSEHPMRAAQLVWSRCKNKMAIPNADINEMSMTFELPLRLNIYFSRKAILKVSGKNDMSQNSVSY